MTDSENQRADPGKENSEYFFAKIEEGNGDLISQSRLRENETSDDFLQRLEYLYPLDYQKAYLKALFLNHKLLNLCTLVLNYESQRTENAIPEASLQKALECYKLSGNNLILVPDIANDYIRVNNNLEFLLKQNLQNLVVMANEKKRDIFKGKQIVSHDLGGIIKSLVASKLFKLLKRHDSEQADLILEQYTIKAEDVAPLTLSLVNAVDTETQKTRQVKNWNSVIDYEMLLVRFAAARYELKIFLDPEDVNNVYRRELQLPIIRAKQPHKK